MNSVPSNVSFVKAGEPVCKGEESREYVCRSLSILSLQVPNMVSLVVLPRKLFVFSDNLDDLGFFMPKDFCLMNLGSQFIQFYTMLQTWHW